MGSSEIILDFDGDAVQSDGVHFKKIFVIIMENADCAMALNQPNLAKIAAGGALLSEYSSRQPTCFTAAKQYYCIARVCHAYVGSHRRETQSYI